MHPTLPFVHLLIALFPLLSQTALVNVTVDDSGSDPITGYTISYTPVGGWKTGKACGDCTAQPSPSLFYRGTWHDSTFNKDPGSNDVPNQPLLAQFTFSGTALYVFCVLAHQTDHPSGLSDMTFSINGTIIGTFMKPAPGTNGFDPNVTVFHSTSLPQGRHDLVIQNGHVNGPKSLMLLDAIAYTYDNGTGNSGGENTEPSSSPLGAILGGVLGGLALLLVAAFAFLYWRRRRHNLKEQNVVSRPVLFVASESIALHADSSYHGGNNGPGIREFNPYASPVIESYDASHPSAPPLTETVQYSLVQGQHRLHPSLKATSSSDVPGPSSTFSALVSTSATESNSSSSRMGRGYLEEPPAYEYQASEATIATSSADSRARFYQHSKQ